MTGGDREANAVRTFINAAIDTYYPERLLVPRDYFKGKKILDVGCGPLPCALAFTDCQVYGLDQLLDRYRRLGFPLDTYPSRMTYVVGGAESMPFADAAFDAVISVNAIDHVDDFPKAAAEMRRVLRPDGILRMEVHYHPPNICEPWCLDDEVILRHFGQLVLRKVHERLAEDYECVFSEDEKLVVWCSRE